MSFFSRRSSNLFQRFTRRPGGEYPPQSVTHHTASVTRSGHRCHLMPRHARRRQCRRRRGVGRVVFVVPARTTSTARWVWAGRGGRQPDSPNPNPPHKNTHTRQPKVDLIGRGLTSVAYGEQATAQDIIEVLAFQLGAQPDTKAFALVFVDRSGWKTTGTLWSRLGLTRPPLPTPLHPQGRALSAFSADKRRFPALSARCRPLRCRIFRATGCCSCALCSIP